MTRFIVMHRVPASLTKLGRALEPGTEVRVLKLYWRGGEHYARLAGGDEIPYVFLSVT